MRLARDEREDFATLLDGLTVQQWQSPSLCDRWRVHDVVAHAIGYDPLNCRQLVRRFAKGVVTSGGANAVGVTEFAGKSPQELVALMRQYAQPRGLTTGFGGRVALTDSMIHQQDIRRPLGMPRDIPAERLRVALDFARWAPPLRGAWRARGVRLVATDLPWRLGKGPDVLGPGEALLMVMAGRRAALDDLGGAGKAKLAQHI
jgi:uncharacterized protein (TIGR03083 family)